MTSAIRDHVALPRPPRALAVGFELGRLFGACEVADFQRRALCAALELLDADDS